MIIFYQEPRQSAGLPFCASDFFADQLHESRRPVYNACIPSFIVNS